MDVPEEVDSEEDAFVMSVPDAHDAIPPFSVAELEDLARIHILICGGVTDWPNSARLSTQKVRGTSHTTS